jgi:hypothetical protein
MSGEVLRDYRNYIHPYKQARHNLHLDSEDARLFWESVKGIARQLITGALRARDMATLRDRNS